MAQAMDDLQQKQIQQAEELLFSGPQKVGFAKELFFGRFLTDAIVPYPRLSDGQRNRQCGDAKGAGSYLEEHLDAAEVDRNSDIPPDVIRGLGDVGVLGMTISPELGGRGLSQQNYCRVMEVIGGHCAATGVFVNAHHSIGVRGLELFGTEEQKQRWMRPMAAGETLAAFALTEPEAGSDASNVQTTATPVPERGGYVLNGEKRYITNGAIAQRLDRHGSHARSEANRTARSRRFWSLLIWPASKWWKPGWTSAGFAGRQLRGWPLRRCLSRRKMCWEKSARVCDWR